VEDAKHLVRTETIQDIFLEIFFWRSFLRNISSCWSTTQQTAQDSEEITSSSDTKMVIELEE